MVTFLLKGLVIILRENFNYSSKNNNMNNIDFDSIFNSFKGNTQDNSSCNFNDNIDSNEDNNSNIFGNIDIGTMMKMKSIIDKMNNSKNDPRSNLLRSLKPYLSSNRKNQIDKYIQIFNISKAFEGLNNFGGENKNDV